MTPQERQLIDDLFDRLAKLETSPRESEAEAAIMQGLRRAPNAVYAMVQTVLLQDEALKRANTRIQELEGAAQEPRPSGSFLDSMRDAVLGPGQSRGSVPNVRPSDSPQRGPVWNSGQALGGARMNDDPRMNDPRMGNPGGGFGGGAPGGFGGGAFGGGSPGGGGGSSFLGTAAATAAGVVGGSMLMSGIRGLMGSSHQEGLLGSTASAGEIKSPWDTSSSNLSRDAGVNDVGKSGSDSSQSSYNQAQADADQDQDQDQDDDDDYDSGDFDDGDSDFA